MKPNLTSAFETSRIMKKIHFYDRLHVEFELRNVNNYVPKGDLTFIIA